MQHLSVVHRRNQTRVSWVIDKDPCHGAIVNPKWIYSSLMVNEHALTAKFLTKLQNNFPTHQLAFITRIIECYRMPIQNITTEWQNSRRWQGINSMKSILLGSADIIWFTSSWTIKYIRNMSNSVILSLILPLLEISWCGGDLWIPYCRGREKGNHKILRTHPLRDQKIKKC